MGVLKNFDCKAVEKDHVVDGSHPWASISPGLSYCGRCKNTRCPAFRHIVIVKRGAGEHLVNDDIMSGVLRCPSCAEQFELCFIALFLCKATAILHTHAEERMEFEARGNEVVKLGSKEGAAAINAGALLSIKVVAPARDCVIA